LRRVGDKDAGDERHVFSEVYDGPRIDGPVAKSGKRWKRLRYTIWQLHDAEDEQGNDDEE
jgi:hypothetical protein